MKTTLSPEQQLKDVAILIPAYEPDKRLIEYISGLRRKGFLTIVIVDDGSGDVYQPIFDALKGSAAVLHHDINRGKGAALKTGLSWIQEHLKDISLVVTADSDGQHKDDDCVRIVSEALNSEGDQLFLGSRDFNLPHIPVKSRFGNKLTSLLFKFLFGVYLPDTQTGLRAFRRGSIPFMLDIQGERFEYEMQVLIACVRSGIPIVSVPIEVIYEDNNKGTHFNPIFDSWRVYKVLFTSFFKFMWISLLSMLVDQGLFNFLNLAVFSNGRAKIGKYIVLSTAIARCISAFMNYHLNKNFVFEKKKKDQNLSFVKYLLLCIGIMLLSALGTWAFSKAGIPSTAAKLVVDTLLYFVSYKLQDIWVFR